MTSAPYFAPQTLRLTHPHGLSVVNFQRQVSCSVTNKKSTNVNKSCQTMIPLAKLKILTPLQKLPKNVVNLGNTIVAKGFKKLPKLQ